MKENNDAIATMDRKVAALCEDISNANDELDDLDDEEEEEEDAPARAKSQQVSRNSGSDAVSGQSATEGQVTRSGQVESPTFEMNT